MGWIISFGLLLLTVIFFIPFIFYRPVMGMLMLCIAVLGGIVGGIMSYQQNK